MNDRGSLLHSRRSKLRTILPVSILLLIVFVIVGGVTHVFDSLFKSASGPASTPTATLVNGADLFYFTIAPWGTVSIDGRTFSLSQLPSESQGGGQPIRLARGSHRIVWNADPFQPVVCTVSVPPIADNACPSETPATLSSGRLITFRASLSSLPDVQKTALLRQIQAVLDTQQSTAILQPGEQYTLVQSSGLASVVTATTPLKASLHFQLDTNLASSRSCGQNGTLCKLEGQDCHQFCSLPLFELPAPPPASSQNTWDTIAVAYGTWDYSTPEGKVIARDQPDTFSRTVGDEHPIPLRISWDGATWHVTVGPAANVLVLEGSDNLTCAPIQEQIQTDRHYGMTETSPQMALSWRFFQALPMLLVAWE